ncbi:uncharacterized protein LOC111064109 isoform X3 [Nilaparvata lugens]|uniref:Seminal fluid protein n=1 Tax=Nilaparvata lugens TaxID=108931 RepID=A0A1I9WLB0_NILLU|nr:uncharacterized protein LOC111064109 isoform X3 [Nilaparvata lugens]APA33930.1 seminal fluid protein [Nilaparvata lugens]
MIGMRLSMLIMTVSMQLHGYVSMPSHANITKRQTDCESSLECASQEEWCVHGKCENPCASPMDCQSWSQGGGYCVALSATGFCRFFTVELDEIYSAEGTPKMKTGLKEEGSYCSWTDDCAPHLYCHTNHKCIDPCEHLVMCTSDGSDDNPGFVVPKLNSEYQPSEKYRCVVENYDVGCH